MSSFERLMCAGCGAEFDKPAKEVRRQRRKDPERAFFCGRSCYSRSRGKANLGAHLGKGDVSRLDSGNRQDQYSAFRYFMNKARNRAHETDLDLVFLAQLWERQGGSCAISGMEMVLPRNTAAYDRERSPWKASLDRIDHGAGYLRGNVRFVVMMANLCRNRFSDEEVRAFCSAVVARQGL